MLAYLMFSALRIRQSLLSEFKAWINSLSLYYSWPFGNKTKNLFVNHILNGVFRCIRNFSFSTILKIFVLATYLWTFVFFQGDMGCSLREYHYASGDFIVNSNSQTSDVLRTSIVTGKKSAWRTKLVRQNWISLYHDTCYF